MRLHFALASILAFATAAAVAPAATVMVYVEEVGEGASIQAPRPVRDGLMGGLFDRGDIVFDVGETKADGVDWGTGKSSALEAIAVEGGAELLVLARSEMSLTRREGGRPLVEVSLTYHVIDLSDRSARGVASGLLSGSNRGKEDEADATAVARGIGTELAAAVHAAWVTAGKNRKVR
jgi:hypothetical protein